MIRTIRSRRIYGKMAMGLTMVILFQAFYPTVALALTGGPSQPEVQSFEPVGTTEMVDMFTGDFTYNIPLLDVGGYPVNLSYHAGLSMDEEASWVGLGWNINPGVINRNMRGLPDDFDGDRIEKEFNMEPNWTVGGSIGSGAEFFGFLGVGFGLGINYNNYVGVGFEQSLNLSVSAGYGGDDYLTAGLGLTSSSSGGATFTPSVSLTMSASASENGASGGGSLGVSFGLPINSRAGLEELTISASVSGGGGSSGGSFGHSMSSSSSISFCSPTYIPKIAMSMKNYAFTGKINLGGHAYGICMSFDMMGYHSHQSLLNKELSNPAFGYLHSENAMGRPEALLDFNRENDMGFSESTPNLPVTSFTYDVLSVTGQGIGGQYRAYRGDVGHVYDNAARNTSSSVSIGAEVTGGGVLHAGVDVTETSINGHSGAWHNGNEAIGLFQFQGKETGQIYEPSYFRQVGELSVEDDEQFLDEIHEDELIDILLAGSGVGARASGKLRTGENGNPIPSGGIKRTKRAKRNQTISYLTINEAGQLGFQRELYAFSGGVAYDSRAVESDPRENGHHIGEISVLRPDGTRYIYGLPAYNVEKNEVSFSMAGVNDESDGALDGLVTYQGTDNSLSNSRGRDNYFSRTTTPPYAHSYLLTAIVSADYVDSDGEEGPSAGDMGSYTLFQYERDHEEYHWRVPVEANKANFDRGIKPLAMDNKGHYIHGKKQIFYLDRIVTNTQTAIFHRSARPDSKGVNSENGGVDGSSPSLSKLDAISLFSTPDLSENGEENAVPIKKVHFQYSQKLCDGIPNYSGDPDADGNKGKLTLEKVWFTYGNSYKGRFSPYEFTYSPVNPDYNIKAYDRWGNYMPEGAGAICPDCSDEDDFPEDGDLPPNTEWPYTDQRGFGAQIEGAGPSYGHWADVWANAWNLTGIKLPSGGHMQIEYEADDYAHVQDGRAGQMFQIVGLSTGTTLPVHPLPKNKLYSGESTTYDHVFFQLNPGDESLTAEQVREKYFNDGIADHLYFRCLTKVGPNAGESDYVTGYARIMRNEFEQPIVGIVESSGGLAYFQLNGVTIDDGHHSTDEDNYEHPISWAAWQFGRMHCPNVVYEQPEYSGDPESIMQSLVGSSFMSTLPELFDGPNLFLRNKQCGNEIDLSKSWVRLQNPNRHKKGGGHRVSRILLNDNWEEMSLYGSDHTYGQEYDYTDGAGSSGVAAWEPLIGGEENPMRVPQYFSESRLLAPDNRNYQESPFGESYYPAPVVGYSKVRVSAIKPDGGTFSQHGTGSVLHEFYTARDYPSLNTRTAIQTLPFETEPILSLFSFTSKHRMTASQGFLVELNDMHGKPKAHSVFAEGNSTDPIASTRYHYRSSNGKLDNRVKVIHKDELSEGVRVENDKEIGVEYDVVTDFRESRNETTASGCQINFASFMISMFYIPVPTAFPSRTYSEKLFRSASLTKVVNRFGILEKVETTRDGSTVTSYNEAYDAETGEVLLTRTNNGFKDDIYTFTYPAHWAYDRMGSAYRNIGMTLALSEGTGVNVYSNPNGHLINGDELLIGDVNGNEALDEGEEFQRAWVWTVSNDPTDGVYIIDEDGVSISDLGTAKVVRSGRRNMQAMPIGTIVSRVNPITSTDLLIEDESLLGKAVLAAGATEYSENWQTGCSGCGAFKEQLDCETIDIGDIATCGNTLAIGNYEGATYQWYENGDAISMATGPVYPTTASGNYFVRVTVPGCETVQSNLIEFTHGEYGHCIPETEPIAVTYSVELTETGLPPVTDNPFLRGLRGNWRPKRSHAYLADRSTNIDPASETYRTDIRNDGTLMTYQSGVLTSFKEFWSRPVDGQGDWLPLTAPMGHWQMTSEVTKVNSYGQEVENKDALGRHSSALFGYGGNLATAVASNAAYVDIAFEHFEDAGYEPNGAACLGNHLPVPGIRTDDVAHSGLYSMRLVPSAQMTSTVTCTNTLDCASSSSTVPPFVIGNCDCVGRFAPVTVPAEGRRFVLSVWVNENQPSGEYVTDFDGDVVLAAAGGTLTPISSSRGAIIDGWQQVTKVFDLTSLTESLDITFLAGTQLTHFDDLRVQPFNSNMKGYVYHPVNLRLMAELDANNYATFYEYDEEGMLIRVKKETERGIMTINESRTSLRKPGL